VKKPDDDALRARVGRLAREVPPARDLWPDIARRIGADGPRRASGGARRAYAVGASALALAAAVALVVATRGGCPAASSLTEVTSGAAPPRAAGPANAAPASSIAGEAVYEGAERALDSELDARRAALPPGEAAVVEENLRIVDQAIEATRSAVLERPDDLELRAELDQDWQDKIDLLRQAIELPSEM
jgi:hypothetical protein